MAEVLLFVSIFYKFLVNSFYSIPLTISSAPGETRTHKTLRLADFKSAASTDFATSASHTQYNQILIGCQAIPTLHKVRVFFTTWFVIIFSAYSDWLSVGGKWNRVISILTTVANRRANLDLCSPW